VGTDKATSKEPRPIGGYAVLLGTYSLGCALVAAILRNRANGAPRLSVRQLVLLALATQHLSRLIAKDSITAPIRSPFTRFVKATGEGEVDEEVIGKGLPHAVGELLSCPYCLGQWVATALVAGSVATPNLTEAFTTICALARISDWLQLSYDRSRARGRAQRDRAGWR
jgi:hypothetical protein